MPPVGRGVPPVGRGRLTRFDKTNSLESTSNLAVEWNGENESWAAALQNLKVLHEKVTKKNETSDSNGRNRIYKRSASSYPPRYTNLLTSTSADTAAKYSAKLTMLTRSHSVPAKGYYANLASYYPNSDEPPMLQERNNFLKTARKYPRYQSPVEHWPNVVRQDFSSRVRNIDNNYDNFINDINVNYEEIIEINDEVLSYFESNLDNNDNNGGTHHRVRRSLSSLETSFGGQNISQIVDPEKEAELLLQMPVYSVQQPYPCYQRDM